MRRVGSATERQPEGGTRKILPFKASDDRRIYILAARREADIPMLNLYEAVVRGVGQGVRRESVTRSAASIPSAHPRSAVRGVSEALLVDRAELIAEGTSLLTLDGDERSPGQSDDVLLVRAG